MQKNSFINRTRLEDSFLTLNNISFRTEVRHYFKVIFLGSASVGKTSIITRFVDDEISSIYKCTLTVDLKMKSILIDDNTWVELQLWDTCGQEIYNTICRQYYNHTKGILTFHHQVVSLYLI